MKSSKDQRSSRSFIADETRGATMKTDVRTTVLVGLPPQECEVPVPMYM